MLYVTERCVFALGPEGLRLAEVAPGIDVERDILAQMAFRPHIGATLRTMDPRIFRPKPMQLFAALLDLQLADRLSYDAERNTLFANFEGMAIRSADDIESVRRVFEALCQRIGHKVALVVNYDGFRLDESLSDAYFEMVSELQAKYYTTAVRYTTSAFMRMKLGAELSARQSAAHVFETHRRGRCVHGATLARRPKWPLTLRPPTLARCRLPNACAFCDVETSIGQRSSTTTRLPGRPAFLASVGGKARLFTLSHRQLRRPAWLAA